MKFLCALLLVTCYRLGDAALTVTRQPPYQGVYIYRDTSSQLPGLTSCQDITHLNNVTEQITETTCQYNGYDVRLHFLIEDLDRPDLDSPQARVYLLPGNTSFEPEPVDEESGWFRGGFELLCWAGEKWEQIQGWFKGDKTQVYCSKSAKLSADVLFLDSDQILKPLQNDALDVQYSFQVSFLTSIWPLRNLNTTLECGSYSCSFKGTEKQTGGCQLTYKSNFSTQLKSLQPPEYQQKHELNITVPLYDAAEYLSESNTCQVKLSLGEFGADIARFDMQLSLKNSTPIVSLDADVGLLRTSEFTPLTPPRCIGDGWPLPDAQWYKRKDDGSLSKLGRFKDKFIESGKKYLCNVSRDGVSLLRHMMFVKADTPSSLALRHQQSYNHKTNVDCQVLHVNFEPKPVRLGWTYPNGTAFWKKSNQNELSEQWSFPTYEDQLGLYICWVEVNKTWQDPEQEDTLRISQPVNVTYNHKLYTDKYETTQRMTTPAQSDTDSPVVGNTTALATNTTEHPNTNIYANYYYLIGLGILGLFLICSTSFIYKIVKKNQAKVSNLDTKLSLDKVKTKMGVNALYSNVQMEEEEPLLAQIPHISKEDLVTDRILGTGQFGKVLKGRLTVMDEDGVPGEIDVAVKCLMHPDEESSAQDFLKEVVMMYQLNHPNVIRLLGVCTEYEQYMIVAEFMAHGNLRDFLMNREPVLSLTDKLYICYQVVCGLEHMVSQNIVHRDIAARNCLVGPNLVVKVADFGLSRSLTMSNYYKKVGGQVPIRWMSPEALKYGKYTPESDVWAFGVLMWEVYTEGHFPYSGYSNEEVQGMLENGTKLHVPPHCTEDVSVLMQATWEGDPAKRPTFRALRTRLNQMLRNSGMSNSLYSTANRPSTSSQDSNGEIETDAGLRCCDSLAPGPFFHGDSLTQVPEPFFRGDSLMCAPAPFFPRDSLARAPGPCFVGEGSSRGCFLGESSGSGTITEATNGYTSEPGMHAAETLL